MKPIFPLALLLGSLSVSSPVVLAQGGLLSGTVERVIGGDDVLVKGPSPTRGSFRLFIWSFDRDSSKDR